MRVLVCFFLFSAQVGANSSLCTQSDVDNLISLSPGHGWVREVQSPLSKNIRRVWLSKQRDLQPDRLGAFLKQYPNTAYSLCTELNAFYFAGVPMAFAPRNLFKLAFLTAFNHPES